MELMENRQTTSQESQSPKQTSSKSFDPLLFEPTPRFEEPPKPDPRTPEFPYRLGEVLNVCAHIAPEPFGRFYRHKPDRERTHLKVLVKRSQLEHCLENPLSDGRLNTNDCQQLKVTKQLRVGVGCGAQLLVVNDNLVAKVFDPLYYSYTHDYDDRIPTDAVYNANSDYTRESAAYDALRTSLGGREIPDYHGSWSLTLPISIAGYPPTRAVRLILLEYVSGVTMSTIKQLGLPSEQISTLMVNVLEAHLAVRNNGVIHHDFEPRNVIWLPADKDNLIVKSTDRVVVIDFAHSLVRGTRTIVPLPFTKQNPRELYSGSTLDAFYTIMPLMDQELQDWLADHW